MHFSAVYGEVYAFQYLLAFDAGMEVFDFQQLIVHICGKVKLLSCKRLSYGAFERYGKESLGLYGKFHGEFVHDLFGIAIDNESYGLLGGYASLIAVEQLVLRYFRSGGFMFDNCSVIERVDIREGVGSAVRTEQ